MATATATNVLDKIVPRDEAGKEIQYLDMEDAIKLDSRENKYVKFNPSKDMEVEIREISREKLQVEFVISSFRRDDFGTRFDPNGVDLEQYRKNPIVLYRHMRDDGIFTLPIARGLVETVRVDDDGKMRMVAEFTPEETFEFGFQVYKLVRDGFLNMASIGAQVMGEELIEEENGTKTLVFTKWKLFEWSVVPIGANDDALVAKREKGGEDTIEKKEEEIRAFVVEKREEVTAPPVEPKEEETPEEKPKEDEEEVEATSEVEEASREGDNVTINYVRREGEKIEKGVLTWAVTETEDQVKYREYYEQVQPVAKLYRALMEKLYKRVGLVAEENEAKAIRTITSIVLSPIVPQGTTNQSKAPATRQLTPEELRTTSAKLATMVQEKKREALRKGVSLGKIEELIPQWTQEALNSVFPSES